eukprot:scaffold55515_cov26-Tisochrysis_lutea.AAC.3
MLVHPLDKGSQRAQRLFPELDVLGLSRSVGRRTLDDGQRTQQRKRHGARASEPLCQLKPLGAQPRLCLVERGEERARV